MSLYDALPEGEQSYSSLMALCETLVTTMGKTKAPTAAIGFVPHRGKSKRGEKGGNNITNKPNHKPFNSKFKGKKNEKSLTCHKCGKIGHFAFQCRESSHAERDKAAIALAKRGAKNAEKMKKYQNPETRNDKSGTAAAVNTISAVAMDVTPKVFADLN